MQAQPENVSLDAKPETKELVVMAEKLLATANGFKVSTAEQYELASEQLKSIKGAAKKLDELRTSFTKPLNDLKQKWIDLFKPQEKKLADAESLIKRAMVAYSDEQDRLRREEQARADEAARKERERLQAQADKAAASGKVEKAEALEQRAATVVAPVISRMPPKVQGVTTREVWKFEVTDEALVPREYCSSDAAKIRAVVNALKGGTKIPGVRVYPDKVVSSSAA